jgi:hypothetical protein
LESTIHAPYCIIAGFVSYKIHISDIEISEMICEIMSEIYSQLHFIITMQYTYIYKDEVLDNTTGETTVVTGGSNIPGTSPGTDNSEETDKVEPPVINCDDTVANGAKQKTKTLFNLITNAIIDKTDKSFCIYSNFIDQVKDAKVEYSTCFEHYTDGEDLYRLTKPITSNKQYSVTNNVDEYTIAAIHNHTNGTPPSIRDVFFTAEKASDESSGRNYKCTFIYSQTDGSSYALCVTDRTKAKEFYESYYCELDSSTNNFVDGGQFYSFIYKHPLKEFNKSDMLTYQLAAILNYFESGIILIKINNDKTITSYSAEPIFDKKKNDISKYFKLTYCPD